MALVFSSCRFGVGNPIILAVVIWKSLFHFFTVSVLKKQVEQYSRIG